MYRRGFHILMAVGLLVCLASFLESLLTRSAECPICGGRAVYQKTVTDPHAKSDGGTIHKVDLYYCKPCDTGVIQ